MYVHRGRHLHRAGVVLGLAVARVGGERRQPVDGEVDLHDAAAGPPALDVADEVVGQVRRADVLEEGALRVHGW